MRWWCRGAVSVRSSLHPVRIAALSRTVLFHDCFSSNTINAIFIHWLCISLAPTGSPVWRAVFATRVCGIVPWSSTVTTVCHAGVDGVVRLLMTMLCVSSITSVAVVTTKMGVGRCASAVSLAGGSYGRGTLSIIVAVRATISVVAAPSARETAGAWTGIIACDVLSVDGPETVVGPTRYAGLPPK